MRAVQALRKVLFVAAALAIAGSGFAAELGTRSSSAAGVTVKVTPKDVAPGSVSWAFEVVLDTHSGDLSDDLVGNAVLLDAKGSKRAPLVWEGSGPGGHHRKGLLRFKAPAGATEAIELQIRRPGESAPRSFRWTLK